MKTLEITETTSVLEMAEQLREVMIAKDANLDEHSGTAFSGKPLGARILPLIDEENGFEMVPVWLVITGKRAFTYVPSSEDHKVYEALNSGVMFNGVVVECLDVAKILNELDYKEIYKKLRKAGFTRRLTMKKSR